MAFSAVSGLTAVLLFTRSSFISIFPFISLSVVLLSFFGHKFHLWDTEPMAGLAR